MIIIGAIIVFLIIFAIGLSSVRQYKENKAKKLKEKMLSHRRTIQDIEQLLSEMDIFPKNPELIKLLNQRILRSLHRIKELSPKSNIAVNRQIEEIEQTIDELDNFKVLSQEQKITIPRDEKQQLTMLRCIKKLKIILKAERKHKAIDNNTLSTQSELLFNIHHKIVVESAQQRGETALQKKQWGSALHYFNKALHILNEGKEVDEYSEAKKVEITEKLDFIGQQMKQLELDAEKIKQDKAKKQKQSDEETKSSDDINIDVLFQPKQKW